MWIPPPSLNLSDASVPMEMIVDSVTHAPARLREVIVFYVAIYVQSYDKQLFKFTFTCINVCACIRIGNGTAISIRSEQQHGRCGTAKITILNVSVEIEL